MHIHLADQYHAGHSIVHRLDPRTKLIIALLYILAAALLPPGAFLAFILLYLLLVVATLSAGINLSYLLKRSFIVIPFALAAVTLPFTIPGETLLTLPIFGGLPISLEGTIRFASILIKSWMSVQAAILLVAVTPFSDLLWGLSALRVPQPLVQIVGFTYRYLFVLSDEALRLMRARSARSASAGDQKSGGSLIWRGKVAGRLVGSLLLRSLERSERIYQAMLARGYTGQVRTLSHPHLVHVDYLVLIVSTILLLSILLISRTIL